jgi:type IV secretory pathway VirB10-like protein
MLAETRMFCSPAGAVVLALLIFVALSIPRKSAAPKPKTGTSVAKDAPTSTASDKSLFPVIDSGRAPTPESHQGFLDERDLERSATKRPEPIPPVSTQSTAPGTLGSIPPFGGDQQWQAPPYQSGSVATTVAITDRSKAEREGLDKSSLVYVRSASAGPSSSQSFAMASVVQPAIGLGLPLGTRLRAHLESAASTAVRAPVLAVIEYNYERDGEIVVPAGAKAIGHLQEANRLGYVRIQFDSLMMPDGSSVQIQAVATTLDLRPPRGKVEGKNTGKNVLVRSLSGIGEAGSLLIGPVSENALMQS